MRHCFICRKPMYTSSESVWINEVNYDVHKRCKKLVKKNYGLEDKYDKPKRLKEYERG